LELRWCRISPIIFIRRGISSREKGDSIPILLQAQKYYHMPQDWESGSLVRQDEERSPGILGGDPPQEGGI
jgi:hypothetical protein